MNLEAYCELTENELGGANDATQDLISGAIEVLEECVTVRWPT